VFLANERNRSRGTNRYIRKIKYGNKTSRLIQPDLRAEEMEWMFEVVFDYLSESNGLENERFGQHIHLFPPVQDGQVFANAWMEDPATWGIRQDPFSSYRAGFEIRTYRLCHRVLMFHHFEKELGTKDYLVRSTEFSYVPSPIGSFIRSVTQAGYVRKDDGKYLRKSLPPLEFAYSQATIDPTIREVDPKSLENLPSGVDGTNYQWLDLDSEGLASIFSEQGDGWYCKRNLSPTKSYFDDDQRKRTMPLFGPLECIARKPNASVASGQTRFLDLAGDGQLDLVMFGGAVSGFYERTTDGDWETFRAFRTLPEIDWNDPNLRFIDLTGDGHTDILITEDRAFTWYASLAEDGFDQAEQAFRPFDEEQGPSLIFADGTQSIYSGDLSGDGLSDLVRIRNGEVCYWPNLGYGCFGAKVTMDNSPWLDRPELFDQKRIRLVDIDGSGTTDILYLHHDRVAIYRNECGNSWGEPEYIHYSHTVDDLTSVVAMDLLGTGTACLVWSSPLPGDCLRSMRYIDLMKEGKPHLLIRSANNLGAETEVHYAPSTYFYLKDKKEGRPWVTRLPFPVHVVERVVTHDSISHNRFVTRYSYRHGYFDGSEREFRGFGMVEQWDTETFAAFETDGSLESSDNLNKASHVPPVLTRTWFHTGAFIEGGMISRQYESEYYKEVSPDLQQKLLLPDTVLPTGNLTAEEIREACRALKGAVLRQEIYACDDTEAASRPYRVTEQNYTIKLLQARGANKHAVFFTHPRETLDFHYERKLVAINGNDIGDPRISHTMTLKVDDYGNVERSVAIGYRRRDFPEVIEPEQKETHIILTANRFANYANKNDWYRVGLPVDARTYEVIKPPEPNLIESVIEPFQFIAMQELFEGRPDAAPAEEGLFPNNKTEPEETKLWPYEKWDWRRNPANEPSEVRLRLIEHLRTLYRPDDLGKSQNGVLALLPLGTVESLALPGESYQLAFTPGLLAQVFQRPLDAFQPPGATPPKSLIPNSGEIEILPIDPITGKNSDRGGYVDLDGDGHWWIPSGHMFYSSGSHDTSEQELTEARKHFFLPRRYRDPFHIQDKWETETFVDYDNHDLLVTETRDALDNRVTSKNDYRVLQPTEVIDPNKNQVEVAFDTLGLVTGTAIKGKVSATGDTESGDNLDNFVVDLTQDSIEGFLSDPKSKATDLIKNATTRIIYDLDCYRTKGLPAFAATIARENHVNIPSSDGVWKDQISFSYSDGFGREIQKKIQAESETPGGPLRWVGSGWTIFNNKGKPVRQYEPFFSDLPPNDRQKFEFGMKVGVSPVLFYDPLERVVATLHPNHTYEKVMFDPWRQITYDVNDTIAPSGDQTGDPRTDPDISGYVAEYFESQPAGWQTWHQQRIGNSHNDPERDAAQKAAAHADTPTIAHFDTLGRPFLTHVHNRVVCANHALDGTEDAFETRIELDIEGNQRTVIDAKGRVVIRYNYNIAGPDEDEDEEDKTAENLIHQASMEAGERWMLNDVAGNPIRAWDSRGFIRCMSYDQLRRPTGLYATEKGVKRLAEQTIYGENKGDGTNHLTRVYKVRDGAGVVTRVAYDFKGNLRESRRDLLPIEIAKQGVDWDQNPNPDDGSFTSSTTFDALNRPHTVTSPDDSKYRPTYNEANLLDKVEVNLHGAPVATTFVENIDYDAKGQRLRIEYGCGTGANQKGVTTTYTYDENTFRLIKMKTTRPAGLNGLATEIFTDPTVVQNLSYTYDPVGNITRIEDAAFKHIPYNNQPIEPVCTYVYDALYRLIEAKGREHIGQTAHDFNPQTRRDYDFVGLAHFIAHPNDLQAMRNFIERYKYDAVGNFDTVSHSANSGSWTRKYRYKENSLIELGVESNRLTQTELGTGLIPPEKYTYSDAQSNDAHGCMTAINGMKMTWDFKDQLQQVDLGGGNKAHYIYDAGGERVRKVIESYNGTKKKERIYINGFEVFREYNGNGTTLTMERETLHVMDDQQRIALVETKKQPAADPVIRYQFANHLGSASLELAEDGELISYEEYYPYGTTSFQAGRSAAEVSLKRYRYTGKERDGETGLSYHGARYYAPWVGRWISCDPIFENTNLYEYARNNPLIFSDSDGLSVDLGYHVKGVYNPFEEAKAARENLKYSISKSKKTAMKQLYAIQAYLWKVGHSQAKALGLKGEERQRFIMAEWKAISIAQLNGNFYLYVDLNSAMEGRGGRWVSWVLERLYHLTQSQKTVRVITGPRALRGGAMGSTRSMEMVHEEEKLERSKVRLPISVISKTEPNEFFKRRTPSAVGRTIVHELIIHAWRNVWFPSGRHRPWDCFTNPGHKGVTHLNTYKELHSWPDIEADLLDYYEAQDEAGKLLTETLRIKTYKLSAIEMRHEKKLSHYINRAGGIMGKKLYWNYWQNIAVKQRRK
jgi:RHS repeat-associated protein